MHLAPLLVLPLALLASAHAAAKSQPVEYRDDTLTLQGILVSDPAKGGKRPGIVLFPDWMGVSEFAKAKAEGFAKQGYVVLVADVFGKGKRPSNDKEAAAMAGIYKSDRPLMRKRAEAGLAQLKSTAGVDTTRLAAMGYCFGGTVALELARTGADLDGTASVHGNLDTPDPAMAKNIKGQVLVLHGAADPYVPAQQVQNFQDEMNKAGVDWYMEAFGGAVHAFTKPEAGNDPSKGQAYHTKADARASKALKDFYAEIFAAQVSKK